MHKTAAPWEELREKYEAGGYTYMQLAKEYGVSVQSVGRHARKENWVSGCRNERRRRAESRDCLLEMTRALMRGAKRAAEEAEKGEACTKELKELADKPEEKAKFIAEKEQEYNDKFSNPYNAARYGYIDDVIEPRNTRFRVIRALQSLATKRLQNPAKKHSNIPL